MSDTHAAQTPLIELLRGVPKDAVNNYCHSTTESQHIPVGRLCNEAADRIAELEAKIADWERRSESCESKLGQLEANEQVIELEAKVRELEAELQRRAKQIGVACMKHDLTHSLACGHCYAESRRQVERLVEALITIDQKLEAAVLCEAKTGQLMPASPLRIDVYKAFAATDQECNG